MDLEYLKTFLAVARSGTISQAAKELYLTQTTVTNRIKELERELGIALFDKRQRNLELTAEGKAYAPYAERSLTILDDAYIQLKFSRPKGTITLASTSNICTYLLPDWLAQFRKRFPDIVLKISTDHSRPIIDQVLRGTIDVGLIRGPVDHNGLKIFPLLHSRIVPIVSANHPWFGKQTVPVQAFNGQNVIAYSRYSSIWIKLENWFHNHGVDFNIHMDLDHVESSKLMVISDHGIAFQPLFTVREQLLQKQLGTFEIDPPMLLYSNTDLIYNRRNPLTVHTEELVGFLSQISKSEG